MEQRSKLIDARKIFKNARPRRQFEVSASEDMKTGASPLNFLLVVFYVLLALNLLGIGSA
ncbi:hypothetical protein Nhal_2261 [Nitrosococcus halophilus Nc 4]|uniref:Uncharacterized protein n=1 Tax=Nitrosococcus halophilus (strain Nc4) TaxID=472759 RepID=D5BUZ9_NITHN|nr:hypothetical protein [Nitrosococcus halophilus]ADE15349.1 hypothetical protein Nhal_2261 [Nitrosococcus halophilus Nc 4]